MDCVFLNILEVVNLLQAVCGEHLEAIMVLVDPIFEVFLQFWELSYDILIVRLSQLSKCRILR